MWRASWLLLSLVVLAPVAAQQWQDPTQPPQVQQRSGASTASGNLRSQSITWNEQQRIAQINGTRLREGERLAEYVVEQIGLDRVTLRHTGNQEQVILALFSGFEFELQPEGRE